MERNGVIPLAKLILKHVRKGVMSAEAQEKIAQRIKALPIMVSLLFFVSLKGFSSSFPLFFFFDASSSLFFPFRAFTH